MDVFFTKNYIKQLDLPEELNKIIDSYIPYAPPFTDELLNREYAKYLSVLYIDTSYPLPDSLFLWVYSDMYKRFYPCIIEEFTNIWIRICPSIDSKRTDTNLWAYNAFKATTKSKIGYLKRQRRIARLKSP